MNEIQPVPDGTPITSRAELMALAVQSGNIEALERIMALQERHEANEARKAYHAAMTAFKADPPKIYKDRLVKFNSTQYRHATLANVTEAVSAALAKHGLSAAWRTAQDGGLISVTCTVTHELGHSESTTLTGSPDNSGQKNSIQQVGSTVTYLQRYTLLALTGLATHEQDDDSRSTAPVTFQQAAILQELVEALPEGKVTAFREWLLRKHQGGIDSLPATLYAEVHDLLKRGGGK